MSMSVNKVTLLGNVGRDPEVRNLPNGGRVANYSLATSERWRDKQSGEQRERTEWHRIVVFNPLFVDITEDRVHRGSKIYLEGKLQTRKWQDQSGLDRYTTEVVLNRFDSKMLVLDPREPRDGYADDGGEKGDYDGPQRGGAAYSAPQRGEDYAPQQRGGAAPRTGGADADVDFDDEIPF